MFAKASALTLAIAGLTSAIHPLVGDAPSGNPTIHPEHLELVPACKEYTITWTPTSAPNKLSIQLLRGPSTNAVPIFTITESTDNTGSYKWTPSSSLDADTERYGLLLVDEVTGLYQYTPQFGISKDASCTGTSSSSSAAAGGYGYGATSASASPSSTGGYSAPSSSSNATVVSTKQPIGTITSVAPSGTGNANSTIVSPTIPMSVPETLKTTAASNPTGSSSASASAPAATGAAGQVRAGLGLAAAVAGLVFML